MSDCDMSSEQQAVVDAALTPQSIVACAGSGKTHTAVHRLASIRRRIVDHRGYVALLSFSNVAVSTFNRFYAGVTRGMSSAAARRRILIETFDSFLTSNVLRPHASRTMGCTRTPYLITGREAFLQNKDFKFWAVPASGKAYPIPCERIEDVIVRLGQPTPTFYFKVNQALLPVNNGAVVVARLAAIGGYTHHLGQYWAYRTLLEQPVILRALARRYPYIVVDEAQDVISVHQLVLELLAEAGVQVSLVGDPCQAIYEFAGADGRFLSEYASKPMVTSHALMRNYRSVPSVVAAANAVSKRQDVAHRASNNKDHGAFFVGYREPEVDQLVEAFRTTLVGAGLRPDKSAIVCRGRDLVSQLAGVKAIGQGIVKELAAAAILRDRRGDYHAAFKNVAACIVSLLADPPKDLLSLVTQSGGDPEVRPLIREIWAFTRNPAGGLPVSTLVADAAWQPALLAGVKDLLRRIEANCGLAPAANLGNRLSRKGLPNEPLIASAGPAAAGEDRLRIDTVHRVKGESLDAVLYVAKKAHVQALIDGVNTELGRIGYVAVTRAKDLFWLGVPASALEECRGRLLALQFHERSPGWAESAAQGYLAYM